MRILIAEDNQDSCQLLRMILGHWGYEVVVASDGSEALDRLKADPSIRLAVVDWMMPRLDGLGVCRRLREERQEPYVYILLLTARSQKEDVVQGMEAGADDYLSKPFDTRELRARLRAGERIIDLQDELLAAREVLGEQATHDSLTGLWNHGAILDILVRELARSQRTDKPLGLVMVDLDHFKQVNDTYGHLAGDAVLREAARRMRSLVRPYDEIGRYGGEEFLVVVPECDSSGALKQAERLLGGLQGAAVPAPAGAIPVTASVGVVACDHPKELAALCPAEEGAMLLLRAADIALYRAKAAGRNRVRLISLHEVATESLPKTAAHHRPQSTAA